MAEEEVVAPAASPIPSDHKRKLEDLEPEAPQPTEANPEQEAEVSAEPDADKKADEVVGGDSPEAKRLRVDEDKPDGLGKCSACSSVMVLCDFPFYSLSFVCPRKGI